MTKHEQGFTIVELMVATAVFSVIMLVVSAGAISLARQHTKGIIANSTQNVTRTALNEVSQAIQFSAGGVSTLTSSDDGDCKNAEDGGDCSAGTDTGYCINGEPYYFVLGKQLNGTTASASKHVLVTTDSACSSTAPDLNLDFASMSLSNPRELLGDRMRLVAFNITHDDSLYVVTMRIAYGDDDLLCSPSIDGACDSGGDAVMQSQSTAGSFASPDLKCRGGTGSQYCYVSEISTTVAGRL